jgi:hypothetical protein
MRNPFFDIAVAATLASLFVVMFWAVQVGGVATAAAAQAKTETYAVSSNSYLPIQLLEAAY